MNIRSTKIAALFFSIMLLAGCTATSEIDRGSLDSVSEPIVSEMTSSADSSMSEPISEPEPEPRTVSFCAVGDNLMHTAIVYQARTADGYDFSKVYKNVEDIIEAADVAVINQETLICNDMYPPSNYPRFNTPTALGDHMIDIGFDIFTIANNHCLDYGEKGMEYTLDYWNSRDVLTAGVYRKGDDRIRLDERDGVVFSYLSFTDSLNGLRLQDNSGFEIGNANDLEEMTSYIKAAKAVSDVCIVALHWGIEESTVITEEQRQTARALSEAGADVILGTSPHVLRDIELIHTEERDTLCAYSLGNFVSAQNAGRNMIGGILNFNVTVTEGEKTVISDIKFIPTITHYDWNYANVRIYKFSEYTQELAAKHGTRQRGAFSYDYIVNFLKNVIDEKYLEI